MKTTRKLMALLMVMAIVFAMAISASADDVPTGTITIKNQQPDKTYNVYRMFDWVKTENGNYWYQINDAWEAFNADETYFDLDEDGFLIKLKMSESEIATAAKAQLAGKPTVDITNKVPYGYYLMVSSLGDNVALGTLNSEAGLTLREKNTADDLPTIKKTIENATQEFKVGDIIDYKIVIECEEGVDSYTIHDTMTGSTLLGAVQVDVEDLTANVDYEASVTTTGLGDNCTFHVTIALKDEKASFEAYQKITITYSATVNESAATVGLSNEAKFEGEGGGSTVEDPKAEYTVKKVMKSDPNVILQGAEFELYVLNGTESAPVLVPVVAVDQDGVTGVDYYRPAGTGETGVKIVAGTATIKMLENDKTYVLKETKAPAGYKALTEPVSASADNAFVVENEALDALPETGGVGTTMFYIIGAVLVLGAATLLVTKKRMAAK